MMANQSQIKYRNGEKKTHRKVRSGCYIRYIAFKSVIGIDQDFVIETFIQRMTNARYRTFA